MDNLQHALMFDSDDGDGFLDDCMPFIPTIDGNTIHDILNDHALRRNLSYHCAETVGKGIINELKDRYPNSKITEIKMSNGTPPKKLTYAPDRTTGVEGYPYVKVDFKWRSGTKELDPNDMDNKHLENSINYVKRLVDAGEKTDIEGERVIRGFKKILEARKNSSPVTETVSEIFKTVKGMESPLISVVDKSTGEVVDLDNIPYAVILDMVKKYSN